MAVCSTKANQLFHSSYKKATGLNLTSGSSTLGQGFPGLHRTYYDLIGTVFFLVYIFTLVGNAIFFVLFATDHNLRKPMYFIILNLAVSDVLFSTTTLPKIIT
ncbi:hypothetical protein Z043_121539, partial [Scleropages formosus]